MARSRYHRAAHAAPARPPFLATLIYYLACVLAIGVTGLTLYLGAPMAIKQWNDSHAGQPQAQPAPTTAPRLVTQPFSPAAQPNAAQALPTASLAQVEATSQAIYQATVQAVDASMPQPNVNTTGDTAPLERQSKENTVAPARPDVATAEPLPQNSDQFGSKAAPVNVQGTHTCLHGQVWTATGCHRPTPVAP